jgi:hypothetical protein
MGEAYQKRWDPVSKARSALNATLIEVEVIWETTIKQDVATLNNLLRELYWAIKDHLEDNDPGARHPGPTGQDRVKRSRIMYARPPVEKDEYRERLEAVVAGIETAVIPHIRQFHKR